MLSHADSRARYDAKGKEGLEEVTHTCSCMLLLLHMPCTCTRPPACARLQVNFMEASTFYQMVFGSENFEDFVGELQVCAPCAPLSPSAPEAAASTLCAICTLYAPSRHPLRTPTVLPCAAGVSRINV